MNIFHWKPFPEATRRERRGTLVLTFLAFGVLVAGQVAPLVFAPEVPEAAITWLTYPQEESDIQPQQTRDSLDQVRQSAMFAFDPNGLPLETWQALGLSRKQAESVHKFEAAGGRFRSSEDVAKLFVVSDELYQRWKPFIRIPKKAASFGTNQFRSEEVEEDAIQRTSIPSSPTKTDLNLADTTALAALPGIGAYTARQIIWHREALGGFQSLDQLSDVKGLRPKNVERASPYLEISTPLSPRNLNEATQETLGRHPYISWNQARAIVAFRKQHGTFENWQHVLKVALVSAEDTLRWHPYFEVGPVPMP